ncbi:MAG: pitrilysin family protein [Dehalococcoidia bacterium]
MYQKTTLPNGLRIVTSTMPHTRSVSVIIFLGAGSRYETEAEAGISHFVEHLAFKGTHKRATPKEISGAIEGVGGILNASTDREITTYWCKVALPHFPLALDVLVDMLLNAKYDPKEMEKERNVILEELNMVNDSPAQLVEVLIDEVVWPDQPLGRDVGGTKKSVNSITRKMIIDYVAQQYVYPNAVVSVAGDISHEHVVDAVQATLGQWSQGQPRRWFPAQDGQDNPRERLVSRETEQSHFCLAVRGLSLTHPDRYALNLLNVILGEGMSSRLFLEIREKLGLAYNVQSYVNQFLDSGSVTIYAGVDPRRMRDALQATLVELDRLKEEIPEEELVKAKELTKGRMLLRMEESRSVAGWLGAQELLLNRIHTVDEVLSQVEAVSSEDVKRVAKELFLTEKLSLAVVGPYDKDTEFCSLLKL